MKALLVPMLWAFFLAFVSGGILIMLAAGKAAFMYLTTGTV